MVSNYNTPWTSTLKTPRINDFISNTHGPNVEITDSPIDQIYTPALIDSIVDESNLYAETMMPPDRFSKWAKITYKAYIGFNILMGINSLPSIEDYWRFITINQWQARSPSLDSVTSTDMFIM